MCNQTTIENWIVSKARQRRESFIYPYNLGIKENFRQTFYLNSDGLTWPVRADCDQYTLTREQLEQEFERNQKSVRYKIIQSYNGSFFPLNYDLYTCLSIPWLSQTRISVEKDDYVRVSRWEKCWLYGYRIKTNEYVYGWFPRCCVDESFDTNLKTMKKL